MKDTDFKQNLAWEFWKIADAKSAEAKSDFTNIEKYWELLFDRYDKDVFDHLYHTLEITLTWPETYESHKALLKKAIQKEAENIKINGQPTDLWGLGREIFSIIKDKNISDFLDIYLYLLEQIDTNIMWYYETKAWIELFKSITPSNSEQKAICDRILIKLKQLYPELLLQQ